MSPGQTYNVNLRVQNTGTFFSWNNGTQLTYRWEPNGGNGGVAVPLLSVGDATDPPNPPVTLGIQAPSNPGSYHLIIDMSQPLLGGSGYFETREAGRPWYSLEYDVCIGDGDCGKIFLPLVLKAEVEAICQDYIKNGSFTNELADWFFESRAFDSSVGTACTANNPPVIQGDLNYAQLGRCDNNVDTLAQRIIIPNGATSADIEYDWYISTLETPSLDEFEDFMTVTIGNAFDIKTLQKLESSDRNPDDWTESTFNLSQHIGQTIDIRFRANNDNKIFDGNNNPIYDDPSAFWIENVAVIVCGPSGIHP